MNEESTRAGFAGRAFTYEQRVTQALCNIYLRPMPLRKDGAVRLHGPMGKRCPGSGSLPLPRDTSESSADPSPQTSPQTPTEDFSTLPYVRILKRLPRALREQSARKLATILHEVMMANSVNSWMCLLLPVTVKPPLLL